MSPTTLSALNKLAKWRSVFTGWQLGTRTTTDAEANAVRDHREVTILLRAEVNALLNLLVEKGVFTEADFDFQLRQEAEWLDVMYEKKFPGFSTTHDGVKVDATKATETTKDWRP